jgi:hypothetical protein
VCVKWRTSSDFSDTCNWSGFDTLKVNVQIIDDPNVHKLCCNDWMLTWRVSLVEQELLTLMEHLSSPLVFRGVRVYTWSLVLYVCFVDRCLSFCSFLLAIVLSILLQYTNSNYPFGIFNLFFCTFMKRNYTTNVYWWLNTANIIPMKTVIKWKWTRDACEYTLSTFEFYSFHVFCEIACVMESWS